MITHSTNKLWYRLDAYRKPTSPLTYHKISNFTHIFHFFKDARFATHMVHTSSIANICQQPFDQLSIFGNYDSVMEVEICADRF